MNKQKTQTLVEKSSAYGGKGKKAVVLDNNAVSQDCISMKDVITKDKKQRAQSALGQNAIMYRFAKQLQNKM